MPIGNPLPGEASALAEASGENAAGAGPSDSCANIEDVVYKMPNSSDTWDGGITAAGSNESGRASGAIPPKADEAPESSARPSDPPPRIQPISERFPALEKQEIILTFSAQEAKEVTVAGDFNDWSPAAEPLKRTGDSDWAVRLMLRSGQYQYRFVVDGWWCEDPQASARAVCPYGGFNSVLLVPLAVRTSIL
jgi:Glycogen recognition site of AMP-activated protein kinase